jgi:hypothetical protein
VKYGFERGWLTASAVVQLATTGHMPVDDDTRLELACLLSDQLDEVAAILARRDSAAPAPDPRRTERKWMYFMLIAAYENRARFVDPLILVEEIYETFDHAPSLRALIRYMPAEPGDDVGVDALLRRWAALVERERDEFERGAADDFAT